MKDTLIWLFISFMFVMFYLNMKLSGMIKPIIKKNYKKK